MRQSRQQLFCPLWHPFKETGSIPENFMKCDVRFVRKGVTNLTMKEVIERKIDIFMQP